MLSLFFNLHIFLNLCCSYWKCAKCQRDNRSGGLELTASVDATAHIRHAAVTFLHVETNPSNDQHAAQPASIDQSLHVRPIPSIPCACKRMRWQQRRPIRRYRRPPFLPPPSWTSTTSMSSSGTHHGCQQREFMPRLAYVRSPCSIRSPCPH